MNETTTPHFFPTAHGDWHVINGELVEMSRAVSAPEPDGKDQRIIPDAVTGSDDDGTSPSPPSLPPSPPAGKKPRNKLED